jgi:hypothetical protein
MGEGDKTERESDEHYIVFPKCSIIGCVICITAHLIANSGTKPQSGSDPSAFVSIPIILLSHATQVRSTADALFLNPSQQHISAKSIFGQISANPPRTLGVSCHHNETAKGRLSPKSPTLRSQPRAVSCTLYFLGSVHVYSTNRVPGLGPQEEEEKDARCCNVALRVQACSLMKNRFCSTILYPLRVGHTLLRV